MLKHDVHEDQTDVLSVCPTSAQDGPSEIDANGDRPRHDDCQRLFLDHLDAIRSIVTFIGKRRRLAAHELEEFAAHVNLKLIEDDYGVFRKFAGRSSLRTYLTVVVQRLFLDWRASQWGKWRPSAFARQHGKVALLLEQLKIRRGLSFEEARVTLDTMPGAPVHQDDLERLYDRIPLRSSRRHVPEDVLKDLPASYGDPATGLVTEAEHSAAAVASNALSAELAALAPDDLRLLKLRFADGLTVAAIARATAEDSKKLYRRIQRLLSELRVQLVRRGIDGADVLSVIGRSDLQLSVAWSSHGDARRRR
jgi:RNA polymerase sigma factor (sigma-70 family)